ncbi:AraC family transcriptional regulator [Pseudoalteromonas denitrificans]|jgi:AraC-like DNA-binding protein|uniref:AraC-type DNA-binding protein n=1 Tax=Pseudoalteromonas denitrificans DSM 6059 TaxID=1123010 RepID=A0A1I1PYC8_9GAMM|nr:AraC family transcriptional regulator [Pseudoalteromonas denitrificans]SFD14672.1 AraC-type DNA-binding protein [Pseudoalteromonas denitrificans DSM 6059]
MEALGDLLRLMQLEVSVYHNAKVCGNWVINEHEIGQTCFHMATESGCLLEIPECDSYELSCGDLVIFPSEMPHSMRPLKALAGEQQHLPFRSDLPGVGMLCGKVHFSHQASQQFLNALPAVLIVKNDVDTPWLRHLLTLIQVESYQNNMGSKVILDKLSELLFTYAIRHYIYHNEKEVGILALYAHAKLSAAIKAMHLAPDRHWNLEQLASIACQSRTGFAQNFKQVSGWTPMQYLCWWRMQLAWKMLINGESVAKTALNIGYQSESAFSRAFKKQFNLSAGAIRKK